jgi:hypothetical protein
MNEILKCDGNNNFKLPHLNKSKLIRENDDGNGNGSVPTTIKAVNYLEAMGWSLDEGDNAINEPTTNEEAEDIIEFDADAYDENEDDDLSDDEVLVRYDVSTS